MTHPGNPTDLQILMSSPPPFDVTIPLHMCLTHQTLLTWCLPKLFSSLQESVRHMAVDGIPANAIQAHTARKFPCQNLHFSLFVVKALAVSFHPTLFYTFSQGSPDLNSLCRVWDKSPADKSPTDKNPVDKSPADKSPIKSPTECQKIRIEPISNFQYLKFEETLRNFYP